MRSLVAAAVVAAVVTPAAAEAVDGRRIVVVDGDTVALPRPSTAPPGAPLERLRLVGIDTPESFHPRCEAELVRGLAAKERLAALVRSSVVEVERTGVDRYGRTLGRLFVSGRNVEAVLLAEGLAVEYRPGREAWEERFRHWCRPL